MKNITAPDKPFTKGPILNRPRTGQDIRSAGGEDLLKKTMINHYKALINVKAQINVTEPHPHVKKSGQPVSYLDQNIVVRNTYKGVANIKARVNDLKPNTFEMKANLQKKSKNPKFEDMEHVRRLNAMSKRITKIGKNTAERNKLMFSFDEKKNTKNLRPQSTKLEGSRITNTNNNTVKKVGHITANPEELLKKHLEERRIRSGKSTGNTNTFAASNTQDLKTTKKVKKDESFNMDMEIAEMDFDVENLAKTGEIRDINRNTAKATIKNDKTDKKDKKGKKHKKNKYADIPKIVKDDTSTFKMELLKYIFSNRIYKDKDIADFRNELFEANKNLASMDVIQQCWEHVLNELENDD